ncbi:hypothetical protein IGJ55_003352 [Enterococcus sp. AZ170]|uniref:hypothetical protein n=1 Tax=Enterococcus sp. AZ170 TaxID=2774747 RepID=UPI003D2FC122
MSEKSKNLGLKFVMVCVYILSYIFLTFNLAQKNQKVNNILIQAKESLDISQASFLFFVVIIIIPFILLMLLATYFFIKILFKLFYKNEKEYNDQIFISLLLTNIVVNTLSLLFINFLSVPLVTLLMPILDFILFVYLFYSSNKNFQATKGLAIAKVILVVANYVIGLVFS